jgi:hypothetical protein
MDALESPSYDDDGFSAFIPFANEKDNFFTEDVRLKIQVSILNGSTSHGSHMVYQHDAPVDTGSTGLAISAAELGYTSEEQLQEYEKGKEYFSSSRVYYEGYWIPTKVTFPDGNVTAEVEILAVTFKAICLNFNETTGNCDSFSSPSNGSHFPLEICYMGIGFGRLGMQQPGGKADRNPLLNIVEAMSGVHVSKASIRQGYVITETGAWVGLAKSNTKDFLFTKLSPNPQTKNFNQPREWNGTNVFIDYHDSLNLQGTALFDTGVTQSYLSAPVFQDNHRLPPGDQYTIKIGNLSGNAIETLHVTVDDFADPTTPTYVRAISREKVFINTGRFFHRSFELLFDAEQGWLGLRRRKPRNPQHSSNTGELTRGEEVNA